MTAHRMYDGRMSNLASPSFALTMVEIHKSIVSARRRDDLLMAPTNGEIYRKLRSYHSERNPYFENR